MAIKIMVVQRNFRYRIYPNQKQSKRLEKSLFDACSLYNHLLETKINAYKQDKKKISQYDLNKLTKEIDLELHSQIKQNISKRIDDAFKHFFRRLKIGKGKAGFPRFKSSQRYKSITFPQSTIGFKILSDKKLYLNRIGNVEIVLHRIPTGKIKTLCIKRKANEWYAIFSCDNVPLEKIEVPNNSVGIDVGLESFATLSNGEKIESPKFLIKSEKKLKILQRKLSRKKKGSRNRHKARMKVARIHLKIDNQRENFLHQTSWNIAKKFKIISIENLQINNMLKNHNLARHIGDAGWGMFAQMLCHKVERTDGIVVRINPNNTSKMCFECGNIQEMPLSQREFSCEKCGFKAQRDFNSALNINRAGLVQINACGDDIRHSLVENAIVFETGNYRGEDAQP